MEIEKMINYKLLTKTGGDGQEVLSIDCLVTENRRINLKWKLRVEQTKMAIKGYLFSMKLVWFGKIIKFSRDWGWPRRQ